MIHRQRLNPEGQLEFYRVIHPQRPVRDTEPVEIMDRSVQILQVQEQRDQEILVLAERKTVFGFQQPQIPAGKIQKRFGKDLFQAALPQGIHIRKDAAGDQFINLPAFCFGNPAVKFFFQGIRKGVDHPDSSGYRKDIRRCCFQGIPIPQPVNHDSDHQVQIYDINILHLDPIQVQMVIDLPHAEIHDFFIQIMILIKGISPAVIIPVRGEQVAEQMPFFAFIIFKGNGISVPDQLYMGTDQQIFTPEFFQVQFQRCFTDKHLVRELIQILKTVPQAQAEGDMPQPLGTGKEGSAAAGQRGQL